MNPDRPDTNSNEVLAVLLRTLNNPFYKTRKDSAIVLRQFDTREASLALANAWSEEDNNVVAIFLLDSLRTHNNDVAKRLFEAMADETQKQREIIWKTVEPDCK